MPPVASTTALAREEMEAARARGRSRARRRCAPPSSSRVHERRLHVDVDALVDAVILERADHLEAGAVADVREARVAMAAEVALQDAAVLRAVEERAPRLELADAGRALPSRAAPPCASCSGTGRRAWCRRSAPARLSRSSTLASAAAMPPSAITVCALPSSDLQTSPTDTPPADALDRARAGPRRPRRRSGRRDRGSGTRRSDDPPVVPTRPCEHEADVESAKAHHDEARPCPAHVTPG